MKPAPFDYIAVRSVDDALEALATREEARVLAGGQSLLPLMNLRIARPQVLVDVNGIDELDAVSASNREVTLGALCRHRRLERDPAVRAAAPLLAEAAQLISHPQVRNRGTLGGSLAHGDPAGELGAALVALRGRVRVRGAGGERDIAASELFEGFFTTDVQPGEMIVEVVVPKATPGTGAAFAERVPRPGDFALAGVGVTIVRDDGGACTDARAGGCGLAATPIDLTGAVEALVGRRALDDDALRDIGRAAAAGFEPTSDVHASAADRRELVEILTVEALRRAWMRAEEASA